MLVGANQILDAASSIALVAGVKNPYKFDLVAFLVRCILMACGRHETTQCKSSWTSVQILLDFMLAPHTVTQWAACLCMVKSAPAIASLV